MTEDIEIAFARRLGDVLGEMRATLNDKAIRRVLTFILSRHGIDVINNTFFCSEIPKTISIKAVSSAPPPQTPTALPTKTSEPLRDVAPVPRCPVCNQNGFLRRAGLGGHMWQKHHIRMTEYVWPPMEADG